MSRNPNDRRAEALERLDKTNTLILNEMKRIRGYLAERPTRREVSTKRHSSAVRTVMLATFIAFTIVQIHDLHIERCGPLTRSEQVLAAPEHHKNPAMCDILFPTHTHNVESWPSRWNLVGVAGFVAILVGALLIGTRRSKFPQSAPKKDGGRES